MHYLVNVVVVSIAKFTASDFFHFVANENCTKVLEERHDARLSNDHVANNILFFYFIFDMFIYNHTSR